MTGNPPIGWAERVAAAVLLVCLLPVLLLIALAIRLDSQGPVLARRYVLGPGGTSTLVHTFRVTALPGAPAHGERMTGPGRLLRSTGLERLPALWDVAGGHLGVLEAARGLEPG